jgi:colanic acid/amylovoran biosynthesis glycosyltransferase
VRGYDLAEIETRRNRGRLFSAVDHFLPVCRRFEETLRDQGCKKPISVVRSPVNVDHIQSIRSEKSRVNEIRLVSICRLVEKKGIIDALSAMSILKARGLNFQYSIVGDGELRNPLLDYVEAHGLDDRVHFLGSLPSSEALGLLESSHILLAPSKMAANGDREGIPNVLKEAMLIGIQVVATNHSGISELIEQDENGYLCEENDPEGLAGVVQFIADHPERWRAFADRASHTILSEYSPEKSTDDLMRVYHFATA